MSGLSKVIILLEHFIEHNEEHANELRRLKDRVGLPKVHEHIDRAIEYLLKCNEELKVALEILKHSG